MGDQNVKLNITPTVRREFNKVKEDIKQQYPDRKIRASEALEELIETYRRRFEA